LAQADHAYTHCGPCSYVCALKRPFMGAMSPTLSNSVVPGTGSVLMVLTFLASLIPHDGALSGQLLRPRLHCAVEPSGVTNFADLDTLRPAQSSFQGNLSGTEQKGLSSQWGAGSVQGNLVGTERRGLSSQRDRGSVQGALVGTQQNGQESLWEPGQHPAEHKEALKALLELRERARQLAEHQIETTDRAYEREHNVETSKVAQERVLDESLQGAHILSEEGEKTTQQIQGAQSGQVKAIAGEEDALAEKLRVMQVLRELSKPIQGRKPRVPMTSVEEEEAEVSIAPAQRLTFQVVPLAGARSDEASDLAVTQSAGSLMDVQPPKMLPLLRLPTVEHATATKGQVPSLLLFRPSLLPSSFALRFTRQWPSLGCAFL